MRIKKLYQEHFDSVLFLIIFCLVCFGLVMVYSASFIYALEKVKDGFFLVKKQAIFSCLGFLFLFIGFRIPYTYWSRFCFVGLCLALLLLSMVFIPGLSMKAGGARRWIQCFGFHFQPAEYAKFALIFFWASQLSKAFHSLAALNKKVFICIAWSVPILVLLLLQPDFGTTAILGILLLCLFFLAGVSYQYLIFLVSTAAIGMLCLIFQASYRKTRLLAFLNPWQDPMGKGFQIIQSFIGIHQGKFWGVGLGNGKEKLFFLPEAHNDFIFEVIAEEMGFLGVCCVLGVYLFLGMRGFRIGWDKIWTQKDPFGYLLAVGITLSIVIQFCLNVAVVLGLVPTKGLTAPFLSYGGSALIIDLFAIGVLLNISKTYD